MAGKRDLKSIGFLTRMSLVRSQPPATQTSMKCCSNQNCGSGGVLLPLSAFNNCSSKRGGKQSQCRACRKEYHITHNNSQQRKEYRENHRSDLAQQRKNRRHTNIQFRLSCNLRSRLWKSIKRGQKAGSAVRDLGCTIIELKRYLESLFQPGMSWSNWGYGVGKWNIHHIIELAKFNLTDREQFLKVAHYTNLQPVWHEDHMKKHKGC